MTGELRGDHVHVADPAEANRIYNKGAFGDPEPGNSLRLSLTEAAYLVHQGRLAIDGADFLALARDEAAYIAYADLRDRGLVVRHDGAAFAVWERGAGPPKPAAFRLHAVSEREALHVGDFAAWDGAIVAVVDEDAATTHYAVKESAPEGSIMAVDLPRMTGRLLGDRVLVDDATPFTEEAYGTPHGTGLWLSLTEAEALRRRGVLDVAGWDPKAHHFDRTLPVFLDLRERGVVAKSGFRFGTHLRGYRRTPDRAHADWLVHCARRGDAMHWSDVSRGVRLAHGVRKSFLVADADGLRYFDVAWYRP